MSYADAMKYYGSDKPDIRFDMKLVEIKDLTGGHGFGIFDASEYVGAICVEECANYTRKQLDELTDFVKRPQIGAKGLIYVRYNEDGTIKSSVDKFYNEEDLKNGWNGVMQNPAICFLYWQEKRKNAKQLSELRLEMGSRLGLRDKFDYQCLWVVDFPLLEKDEELNRYFARHHPLLLPNPKTFHCLTPIPKPFVPMPTISLSMVWKSAEDLSVSTTVNCRKIFSVLGFTEERAEQQFGFLMNAFRYGAPPHGGIAFGLDRLVSLFAGLDSIRDCIAFPKTIWDATSC